MKVSTAIRSEGALLPRAFLERLAARDRNLDGLTPESYHLLPHERLPEAVSRSWNRLLEVWGAFRRSTVHASSNEISAGLTRDRWLLPLFSELGYGRLGTARALEVEGKSYPVSHSWQNLAIHLVGWGVELDRRSPGVPGAARTSPHSLVQELLNRSEQHLWGLVSNGRKLRLLRDSRSLARQAYVELDLEAIFDGGSYPDFLLLFLLLHQSRLEGPPASCWLERWAGEARQAGTRALDRLRLGVERAIEALGQGLVAHRDNQALRQRLATGELSKQELYRQLLRTVYRLIFLLVAEERDLLAPSDADPKAKKRYTEHYSASRLRNRAGSLRGTAHGDLWESLKVVVSLLDQGSAQLALPALGSFLWSRQATPELDQAALANRDLLEAMRALAFTEEESRRRPVDFRNLGPEELGSVYESLLELHPEVDSSAGHFRLATAAGHERKTTGSYYTPSSLIECLLDTALDPVLDQAVRGKKRGEAEAALLTLKVCDPACGSGHFLLAAAHRIARRLAAVRTDEEEPPPEDLRHALRDVIGRCLYGVDLNPMALELCKVSLWLEALDPGRPLSFLDHHLRCGNSLLGATPALLARGVPDEALEAITGDDKAYCTALKRLNKKQRTTQQFELFALGQAPWMRLGDLGSELLHLEEISGQTLADERKKEEEFRKVLASTGYEFSQLLADAWCAAFVWRKVELPDHPTPITEEVFRRLERNPHTVPADVKAEVKRLAEEHRFFHWHLAFPHVFQAKSEVEDDDPCGWDGGFDCVLGNPPWERLTLKDKEWFAEHSPDVLDAKTAHTRRQALEELAAIDSQVAGAFSLAKHTAAAEKALARNSGAFPLCGAGDVNSYALFAERAQQVLAEHGRCGLVVQTAIATTDTAAKFFEDLVKRQRLVCLLDFSNKRRIFPGVQGNIRFSLLTTMAGMSPTFRVGSRFESVSQASDVHRTYELSLPDLELINPNSLACPLLTSRREVEMLISIHRRLPILFPLESSTVAPWPVAFSRMLHMGDDSHLFHTLETLTSSGGVLSGSRIITADSSFLPLYEAKLVQQFNHRHSTFEGVSAKTRFKTHAGTNEFDGGKLKDPDTQVLPRYWVAEEDLPAVVKERPYLLSIRDAVSATADVRSLVAAVIPSVPAGHTLNFVFVEGGPILTAFLVALLNSIVLDFVFRRKAGSSHASFFVLNQLPAPPVAVLHQQASWSGGDLVLDWFGLRVLELTYTAWDLQGFGKDLGYDGPPFRWNEDRRFDLRAELDAAFFHLYGLNRDDTEYILGTFEGLERNEVRKWGRFRTKERVLELYDAMARAIATGVPYQTVLDPPPADPRVAHLPRFEDVAVAMPPPPPAAVWAGLAALADRALERLSTLTDEDVALMALIETLRHLPGPADPQRMWLATELARKPALASLLFSESDRTHWLRTVGPEAQPPPENVTLIAHFQPNAKDRPWAEAVSHLKATGRLLEDATTGVWSAGPDLPAVNVEWLVGRVKAVLPLVDRIETTTRQETETRFASELDDDAARRAVS